MKSLLVILSLLVVSNVFSEELASVRVPTTGMSFSSDLEEVIEFVESELSDPRSELSEYVDEYGEFNINTIAHTLRKVSEHVGISQGIFTKAIQYSLPIFSNGKIVTEFFVTAIEDESKSYLTIIIEDRASIKTGF